MTLLIPNDSLTLFRLNLQMTVSQSMHLQIYKLCIMPHFHLAFQLGQRMELNCGLGS